MKMKRVLHVIDHLGLGGAQTIVRDLVDKNSNYRVLALRGAKNEVYFSSDSQKRCTVLDARFKFDFTPVLRLKEEIEKYDIDVLHVHLARAIFIVYLYKLIFKDKTIVIVNEHGAIFSKKRWFYRFLLRRIDRYTKRFIAVSKKIKDSMVNKAFLRPEKIEVVYNFIDFDELIFLNEEEKVSLRKSINLRKDDFVIGYVGRLHGAKYVDTLINSYKLIKDNRTKIIIIGDGDEDKNLRRLGNGEKGIIFLGFRKDVKKLYQIMDVIVLPSRSEASPMAFYESQVYGVPFVGSDVYAINEFIKSGVNGFLFRFEDSRDLAKKIIIIRDDKELRERISQNALLNLKKYDIKVYNNKMKRIYSGG